MAITTASFGVAFIPALFLVMYSGFFGEIQDNIKMHEAIWYLLALAIIGTAWANILFNKLIHISSPVFAIPSYFWMLIAIISGFLKNNRVKKCVANNICVP